MMGVDLHAFATTVAVWALPMLVFAVVLGAERLLVRFAR